MTLIVIGPTASATALTPDRIADLAAARALAASFDTASGEN